MNMSGSLTANRRPPAHRVKKIILFFTGLLISIILLECLLALFPEYRLDNMVFGYEMTGKVVKHQRRYFRSSKLFGVELIPNADLNINSFGMYDKECALEKPENTSRILVLGDSTTCFNKWPDLLEEKLNMDGNFEVLNCAVNGWELYNYYLYLKHKGLGFDPDIVLVAFCLNDIPYWNSVKTVFLFGSGRRIGYYTLDINGEYQPSLTLKINPFLFSRSRLYRLLILMYYNLRKENREESAMGVLQQMKQMAGDRLYAVVFPYLKLPEDYSEKDWQEYQDTIGHLKAAEIPFLDLKGLFEQYGEGISDFRFKPEDHVHFNEKGNRIQSEAIYSWLKKQISK